MDFALTDQQEAIRDAIAKVCEDFPDAYWLKKDHDGGFPHDFHKAMADAGWLGICVPEEYGGSGLGITEAAIMMRTIAESGAGMSGASAVHINVFGLNPVVVFAPRNSASACCRRWSRAARRPASPSRSPNTGLNTTQLKTRAVAKNDRYIVNGQKVWISTAQVAHKIPAAGAHHAAGGGALADPWPQPVLHRLRPQEDQGPRDREDGPQDRRFQRAVLRGFRDPDGGTVSARKARDSSTSWKA